MIDPGLNALFRHYRARQPKAEAMELTPEALKYLIVSCQKGPILLKNSVDGAISHFSETML